MLNRIEDVLIFQGSNTDTNSDNKIDSDDFQLLYVYYLSDGKLVRYNFDQKTVIDFEKMKKTDLIAISLGADSNNDFKFDDSIEPKEILTLNLKTRNLIEIIPPELKSEIQLIIDGHNQ